MARQGKKTEENMLLKRVEDFAHQHLLNLHPAIGIAHMETTVAFAREIARTEKADLKICSIAAMLHDIGLSMNVDIESETPESNHGITSTTLARPFLSGLPLSKGEVAEICTAVSSHCFPGTQQTIPARILWDADKLNVFSHRMYQIYRDYWEKKGLSKKEACSQIKRAQTYYKETFYTTRAREIAEKAERHGSSV